MKEKVERYIIVFVSFFLYSGYYVGLSLFFASNLQAFTRFYSVPLRILLSGLMLYYIFSGNLKKLKKTNLNIPIFLLFAIFYIFKVFYSEHLDAHLSKSWMEYVFYFVSYSVLPFIFYACVDFQKYKNSIVKAMIWAGLILGLLTVFIFKDLLISGGGIDRISRLTGETGQEVISPLALAYSGAFTLVLCFYNLIFDKSRSMSRLVIYLAIALSLLLFFLGATRGALVAVLLSVLAILYFGDIKRRLISIFIFILSIPFIYIGLELTGSGLFKRTASSVNEGDISGRETLWSSAYDEFLNYPLFGGRIEVSGIYPHNIFLEILMAMGLIGLLLFLFFFIPSLLIIFRKIGKNGIYIVPFLIFICGFSHHLVSGALWAAITVFAPLGMFNSRIINEK